MKVIILLISKSRKIKCTKAMNQISDTSGFRD